MVDYNLVYFGVSVFVIYILYKILTRWLNSGWLGNKFPDDVVNGLILIFKFVMAILVVYSASIFLDLGEGTTIVLSIFLGSIITFASINTIQNLVSGIYILVTEPFSVNDLVKIDKNEGLVVEISLNYTSLLTFEGVIQRIPNKKIINSLIINYDQKVLPTIKRQQEHLDWMNLIVESIEDREITRYVFVWGAPLIALSSIKQRFDKVCDEFAEVFGYTPEYMPYTLNHRFEYSFILRADNPITILKHKTNFQNAINAEFH